jgi:glycosyltransferase involved in cell wall biosynthesis
MGRLTGAIAGEAGCRCVAHLRDIIRLSGRAIADLNRNDLLIAVSQATRDYHVAQGLDAARTRVVYNGVDCERFHPRAATGSLKRELQLPADSFLIATIGQIGLRKGQDVLAEAAVLLKDRLPTAHYLLVGARHSAKAESITFEKNVQARFADAGLPLRDMAGRLHCVGYREDVDRLLNEVDLLVHPAHQEPLGRVLLEAAAAGTPIVATDVGGTGEILEDGRSARLVPPNDPQALADAIIELHDARQLRTRFSTAARERAEALFNIRAAADGLATIWRELISVY